VYRTAGGNQLRFLVRSLPVRRAVNRWVVAAMLAVMLAGCASRPGPELLIPIAALPGVRAMTIYVATTRERASPSQNLFTANRAETLNFSKFAISVPPDRVPGSLDLPTEAPDVERSFAVVDQAVMSEADFQNAVAPRSAARRKKHKVFLFVHGFNNNFQESLFRLAQMQADTKFEGIPVLFSWPSQGQVAAYTADKEAASGSRTQLMALLTMLTNSPAVGEIMVMAHSMGGMLTMEALQQLRNEGKNRVIARLGRVVLAAPDIDAYAFRDQVQAVGPLKPPLLVLVSKDDGALRFSSFLAGSVSRAGSLDIDNPLVRQAALRAKVQVVDISRLASHDDLQHNQFVSVAVLYSRLRHEAAPYRNTPGTFIFTEGTATVIQPVDIGAQAHVQ
jgi:esterase/lipase superfamily enzyme